MDIEYTKGNLDRGDRILLITTAEKEPITIFKLGLLINQFAVNECFEIFEAGVSTIDSALLCSLVVLVPVGEPPSHALKAGSLAYVAWCSWHHWKHWWLWKWQCRWTSADAVSTSTFIPAPQLACR